MVPGLNTFREWFDGYHRRHVIIGGTACNLIYAQYGAPERATKDIDLVVLAEAFDRAKKSSCLVPSARRSPISLRRDLGTTTCSRNGTCPSTRRVWLT